MKENQIKVSANEIKFTKEYEEKFIMQTINPNQKTLLNDELLSEIDSILRRNIPIIPIELSFDTIPILKILKRKLESEKTISRKKTSKLIKENRQKLYELNEKINQVKGARSRYFKQFQH